MTQKKAFGYQVDLEEATPKKPEGERTRRAATRAVSPRPVGPRLYTPSPSAQVASSAEAEEGPADLERLRLTMDPGNHHYEVLFHRYPKNPILTAGDWPYPINSVFNAAAT